MQLDVTLNRVLCNVVIARQEMWRLIPLRKAKRRFIQRSQMVLEAQSEYSVGQVGFNFRLFGFKMETLTFFLHFRIYCHSCSVTATRPLLYVNCICLLRGDVLIQLFHGNPPL